MSSLPVYKSMPFLTTIKAGAEVRYPLKPHKFCITDTSKAKLLLWLSLLFGFIDCFNDNIAHLLHPSYKRTEQIWVTE